MNQVNYRTEKDSMGERQIPESAYYGIQTLRAIENFPISGLKPLATYVDACILIKKAAAIANGKLGCINEELTQSIVAAADEILQGKLREQFVVDVYQAGAGTSHHMNVNEVLANRALEILGDIKGNYQRVNPNDHVNYGQSTNDVIPTAIRVGGLLALSHTLLPALDSAIAAWTKKQLSFNRSSNLAALTCKMRCQLDWVIALAHSPRFCAIIRCELPPLPVI